MDVQVDLVVEELGLHLHNQEVLVLVVEEDIVEVVEVHQNFIVEILLLKVEVVEVILIQLHYLHLLFYHLINPY